MGVSSHFPTESVSVIKNAGTPEERRVELKAHIQSGKGFFDVDAAVYEGDVVELPDPRGGLRRLSIAKVKIVNPAGMSELSHIEVTWGDPPQVRTAPVRRLGLEGLHPAILQASSDLYTDGHYAQAIFEAFKAVEVRVRSQSGVNESGERLMSKAFGGSAPPITVSTETGRAERTNRQDSAFSSWER